MGQIRFRVYDPERISRDAQRGIYMCGLEEIPWRSRTYWDDDLLVLERLESESGRVSIPWQSPDGTPIYVTTATIIEREAPYVLEVELARGLIQFIRVQLAAWQPAGLVVSDQMRQQLTSAQKAFFRAATSQHDLSKCGERAVHALETALDVTFQLGKTYCDQALAVRRHAAPQMASLLGIDLGAEEPRPSLVGEMVDAFNMAMLPCNWQQIEGQEGRREWDFADAQIDWAKRTGLRVCCGPLVRFDRTGFPDWMYLWEGDLDNLAAFVRDHVCAVVDRYRGRVHLWHVASKVNLSPVLSLDDDQRLRIVAEATEAIRQLDPRTPVVASFDRPWGEYLADEDRDLAPLHFADTLVRADVGLAGLGLEVAAGYWPQGSFHRHALAYSRLLDQWSMLGLPLMLMLSCPSDTGSDPQARHPNAVVGSPLTSQQMLDEQAKWLEMMIPIALSKQCVQVVSWHELDDSAPHDRPYAGIFDKAGNAKPVLSAIRKLKQQYFS